MTSRSIMMALSVLPVGVTIASPASPTRPRAIDAALLQPLTPADMKVGRVHGVGCSWSLGRDTRPRLVMSDDHALARIDGTVTIFMAATGAKDLFPFTFDRWQGGETVIQVREYGPSRRDGSEALVTKADLLVRHGPNTSTLHGIIACGS